MPVLLCRRGIGPGKPAAYPKFALYARRDARSLRISPTTGLLLAGVPSRQPQQKRQILTKHQWFLEGDVRPLF